MTPKKPELGVWSDERWTGNFYHSGDSHLLLLPGDVIANKDGSKCYPIDLVTGKEYVPPKKKIKSRRER